MKASKTDQSRADGRNNGLADPQCSNLLAAAL